MNNNFIFIISDLFLILDYNGNFVVELYFNQIKMFCYSKEEIAIFSDDNLFSIKLPNNSSNNLNNTNNYNFTTNYNTVNDTNRSNNCNDNTNLSINKDGFECRMIIPVRNVSFCCFNDDILYFRIFNGIFKLVNNLIVKVRDIANAPLAICEKNLIVLSEPISIVPKPSVDYLEIRNKKVKEIGIGIKEDTNNL